jgi:lysophospholipase L1-like esterase
VARLPQPGGDAGQWGQILNDYLSEAHEADGSLKSIPQSKVQNLATDLAAKADTSALVAKANTADLGTAAGADSTDFATAAQGAKADAAIPTTSRGQVNGVATLDGDAKLPEVQVPTRLGESELNATFAPLRRPTLILFGDSRTADCDYSSGLLTYSTNMSWIDWGQGSRPNGPTFDIIRNAGISGNTTQQLLDRVDADVIAFGPSHVTLWAGMNDGWTMTAHVDASYARMVQILEKLAASGIFVFLISETTGSPPLRSTPFPALVGYYNDRLRTYAADHPGIEYWDFNALIVDPTNANGYARGAMLRDGLHLGPLGASKIGRDIVAPKLAKRAGDLAGLAVSQYDTRSVSAVSRNIANNPLMQGTTGTVGSGHTGQLPSAWASSGNVAAVSVVARPDGVGNNARIVLTATSTASLFLSQQIDPARLVPGKRLVIEAALGIDAATNVSAVSLTFSMFETGGVEHRRGFGYPVQATAVNDSIATGDRVLRSRVFVVPTPASGSFSGCTLTLRIGPSSASAVATVELGRVSVRQLD